MYYKNHVLTESAPLNGGKLYVLFISKKHDSDAKFLLKTRFLAEILKRVSFLIQKKIKTCNSFKQKILQHVRF